MSDSAQRLLELLVSASRMIDGADAAPRRKEELASYGTPTRVGVPVTGRG